MHLNIERTPHRLLESLVRESRNRTQVLTVLLDLKPKCICLISGLVVVAQYLSTHLIGIMLGWGLTNGTPRRAR